MQNKYTLAISIYVHLLPVLLTGKLHWFIGNGVIDTCEIVACDVRVVCMNDFTI